MADEDLRWYKNEGSKWPNFWFQEASSEGVSRPRTRRLRTRRRRPASNASGRASARASGVHDDGDDDGDDDDECHHSSLADKVVLDAQCYRR